MKVFFLLVLLAEVLGANAQYVGPPNNVGREYGNPKMPMVVSHLAGANKERLKRATRNSRHSIFSKVLCFRRLCRIQSGHSSSLRAISFEKFRKKIRRNAKKGLYKREQSDSTSQPKPFVPEETQVVVDTLTTRPTPAIKRDSLIVLGAELLFETNRANLRSDHLPTLNSIVKYLVLHPERSVKISGHTDDTGSEEHNLALSKRRADTVAEYLTKNGVSANRVETFGRGSAKPIDTNDTDAGRKKNRRVELLIREQPGP